MQLENAYISLCTVSVSYENSGGKKWILAFLLLLIVAFDAE